MTQRDEATAKPQDMESCERFQETLALIKILALSDRQIAEDRVMLLGEAIVRARSQLRENHPLSPMT